MVDTVRANIPADFALSKGDIIKIVADAASNGKAWVLSGHSGNTIFSSFVVAAGATVTIGPYNVARRMHIECYAGALSYANGDAVNIMGITQAAYDALTVKDANTLYVING
jgi:hypothetical protein